MKKNILLSILACVALCGCKPTEPTVENTLQPGRFRIKSADYCKIPNVAENFALTVLTDTQGTNDLVVATTPSGGVHMLYIPKPIKQLEDNR